MIERYVCFSSMLTQYRVLFLWSDGLVSMNDKEKLFEGGPSLL